MNKLIRFAPHGRRSSIGLDLNRVFDEIFAPTQAAESGDWRPRVDISESDGSFALSIDLPGVPREDVSISFEDDVLTVSGERKLSTETESGDVRRAERVHGRFSRSFTFPKGVAADKISATFENGVLAVTVPKTAQSKARTIKIS